MPFSRKIWSLSYVFLCVGYALGSSIIFPLYIYPSEDCWASLQTAVNDHPGLNFYFIINPNSGPGDLNTQPDSSYQACTTQLKNAGSGNSHLIGYVSTRWGDRDPEEVRADIQTYAGWSEAYRLNGIFFDEEEAGSEDVTLYEGYAADARAAFPGGTVVFNPGTVPSDNGYFAPPDFIVTAEYAYADFPGVSSLPSGPETPLSKQAVILYAAPNPTDATFVESLVDAGIGALFLTSQPLATAYSAFPNDWQNFVDLVDGAQ